MMKKGILIFGFLVLMTVCTSCRIPTLPPLDSTITIEISRKTDLPQVSPTQEEEPPGPTEPVKDPTSEATDIPPTQPPEPSPTHTVDPTPTEVPPTQTPEPSPTPTYSATPKPTLTPTSTPTSVPEPTDTPTPTPVPYRFQEGSPAYMSNFAHPEEGCAWLGIAGQIFNREGEVVKDVVVKAGGTLNGVPILTSLSLPGAAKAYGPGGYELVLSDAPVDSEKSVWIQLFDFSSHPLSEKTYLNTYETCDKNLILINFIGK